MMVVIHSFRNFPLPLPIRANRQEELSAPMNWDRMTLA